MVISKQEQNLKLSKALRSNLLRRKQAIRSNRAKINSDTPDLNANDSLTNYGLMNDAWISHMSKNYEMISPFVEKQTAKGKISYGLSSYGYDARIAEEFFVFTNVHNAIVDPKNFTENSFVKKTGKDCLIPPNTFCLARSVEYFKLPENVMVVCLGKSTYARCGIIVNVTPLEPGWEGHVTLEFSNTTPLPAKIYANEGACQFLFFKADKRPLISYKDRQGKYQKQRSITLPKL